MTANETADLAAFHADTAKALATFSPADSAIAQMRDEFMPLKINGLDDRAGYAKVHAARMVVKNHRVAIEKKRKELKSDALEYGRKIDGEASRLASLLEPIEVHLEAQEKAVDAERERIKAEAEAKARAKLDERVALMAAVGGNVTPSTLVALSDAEFADMLRGATATFEARQEIARQESEAAAKKAAEEADAKREQEALEAEDRRKENERLATARAKLDADRKAHEDSQRQIEAERQAFEEEKRREALARQAREEAERVRVQAEREAEERKAREAAIELRRPVAEKLRAFAVTIESLELPAVDRATQSSIVVIMSTAAEAVRRLANGTS